MKTTMFLKSAVCALAVAVASPAFADCSFDAAQALTVQRIKESAANGNYAYGDIKLAMSRDNATHITEVLLTFKATFLNEQPSDVTMLGYSHLDQNCNSIDSLITVGGNVAN